MPTAVTIVTAAGSEGWSGATANAVLSLSLSPPLMLAALDRGSRTLATIEETGRFGINVLGAGQAGLARRFSTKDPHPQKWEGVEASLRAQIPMIGGSVLWLACELTEVHAGGDHRIVVGQVRDQVPGEGDPLLFLGGYRPLDGG
jgi:flavin reductase (DIM6/NTAB) family NADH-FMN oxidoreductase RutF